MATTPRLRGAALMDYIRSQVIDVTCARCGGPAKLHPEPWPRGICICPKCSPQSDPQEVA